MVSPTTLGATTDAHNDGRRHVSEAPEGRLLCLLLAVYGFAIFGYVTASVASFFVARDADSDASELAGARQVEGLRREIAALRSSLERVSTGPLAEIPREG